MPDSPLLLVLDGNSLVHRAYHAGAGDGWVDQDGRPIWALRGLVGFIARAAAYLRPDALLVGFDCPLDSARRADYAGYKAHRPDKAADLVEQILCAPELLTAAGVRTLVPPAYEADDVLASSAAAARGAGWRSVLMTSDRDAFALIDESTSVLRVRNGGFDEAVLVDAAGLVELCGVESWQYRDFAALRGDPSDNLHGVRGFGEATAAKLLAAFGSVETVWTALDSGQGHLVREAVGEAAAKQLTAAGVREKVARNQRLMRMRTDLPIPDLESARLPLSLATMRTALRARGINLGPSLWALTGGVPPQRDPDPREEDVIPDLRPWVIRGGMSGRRDPTPGQMSLF
ncbi:5'-3' exonuclease H3TH domain-containing protein [Actinoplanes sp. TFC3]|uniref:5'-3' exonuclease n=1 Tax=Actinoplanes sp. TFC3 TaxID=1710355 RepID=UPI000833C9C4|nr:5'-3' exonuclease H3TH domain-containing protein [Actinoplanes sp. TFC3]